ncbi:Transferase domain-containing protein [Cephalotus follicularis]|uniref:Transferase domain-containing protein n=1 Tax=Cephalotus follicularis TaxID=3775 RepID=A0A1Q3BGE7_CEPFO|nr:Transferase domain-containing protein [Cephalotus follicularis]
MNNMESRLVFDMRISTVVPAKVTGDNMDVDHEFTSMDLALKLHYIKGVYFFKNEAVQGISINELKTPMFTLLGLEPYYTACGRIRRRDDKGGRPFIKCNDAGIRIVEARSEMTVDQWLAMEDRSLDTRCLAYGQVLGPDIHFSPLVYVQFTSFTCGGMSVGLSWAHILGDIFFASNFINKWSHLVSGHVPKDHLHVPKMEKSEFPTSIPEKLLTMKKVNPVGDHWLKVSNRDMRAHYFHISPQQLDHIASNVYDTKQTSKMSHFELLSAIIWKLLSKIRGDSELRDVTICTNGPRYRENGIKANGMVISRVQAEFSLAKAHVSQLAMLIDHKKVDESEVIEETLRGYNERLDFIVYGANLTFVNLEEANIYGLELKGQGPEFVNYIIDGVGDEGVVLVLPGPKVEAGIGRTVSMVLPENQLARLIKELEKEWNLV